MNKLAAAGVMACVLLSGCASITGDSVQAIRVETRLADGTEVRDADCELFNEYGSFKVKSPGSVMVHRSSTDINVACKKDGLGDAQGTAVSRANGGMWGNIIFGGGIGAVIDHNKGTAYTYPQWMQLTFGKIMSFDRRNDKDGQPSLGREAGNTSVSAVQPPAAPVANTPVSTVTADNKAL